MRNLVNDFLKLGISARALAQEAEISYGILMNYLSGYRDTFSKENQEKIIMGINKICEKFETFKKEKIEGE